MSETIAVVGAGQAGAELVRALRRDGYGGRISLFGRESFPPYERPPLSKKFLHEALEPARVFLRNREAYEASGIGLLTGSAVAGIDTAARTIRLADGETHDFDACVLATGSDPRRPSIPGMDLQGVHVLRTIDDALSLRSALKRGTQLVIVGGGYLGLEVASSARASGVDVVVIEGASTLMQRSLSPIAAAIIADRHRDCGTRFLFDASVRSVNGESRVESVTTSNGDLIGADAVLFAIGADPAVDLARVCGLCCENGIVVDERCRTSAGGVYAIGDCASQLQPAYGRHQRLEAVSSALFHARCAAADILDKPPPAPKPASFWSEQCDFMLQIMGTPAPGIPCEDVFRGDRSAFSVFRFQEGALVTVETVNRPKDFVRARTMIGQRNVSLPAD